MTASRQTPRIATCLVELFSPSDQVESILGDLHEEFSEISSKSGLISARLWYWRQAVKTIVHLAGSAFRVAPLAFFGIVVLGFFLSWFAADLPEKLIVALLRTQRPYSNLHVAAYMRFMTYGIPVARTIQSMIVGCIVAALAKGREVLAAIALSILRGALSLPFLFLLLTQSVSQRPELPEAGPYLALNAVELGAMVIAGVMVRKFRSLMPPRLASR